MKLRVQCSIHRVSPVIPIISRVIPVLRIDYFLKINFIIFLPPRGLPEGLFSVDLPINVLKALHTYILAT
jgi:hypothetical protein